MKFNGRHLFANFVGKLRVELIDESGQVVGTSESVSGDSTKQKIELPGLEGVTGKPVRFRFHLEDGSLYAFWVSRIRAVPVAVTLARAARDMRA